MSHATETRRHHPTETAPSYVLSLGGGPNDRMTVLRGSIGPASMTFECWMKMSTAPGVADTTQTLLSLFSSNGGLPRLDYLGGDRLGLFWAGASYASADTTPISDGAWHHIALVIDSGYVTFYKDGVATADTIQVPSQGGFGEAFCAGAVPGFTPALNGELHDIRAWSTARTTAQISSYRYVSLTGTEPGLEVLIGFPGPDSQIPVNVAKDAPAQVTGNVRGVPAEQVPQQPPPTNVWTYQVDGESPAGPALSPQGLLCTDNATGGTAGTFVRSVELETGQVSWSYDVQAHSDLPAAVVPTAVGIGGSTVFAGAQARFDADVTNLEVHQVDVATGAAAATRSGSSATRTS